MNVKIEQELNFVVDNDSRLFLDAQEAKKVRAASRAYSKASYCSQPRLAIAVNQIKTASRAYSKACYSRQPDKDSLTCLLKGTL